MLRKTINGHRNFQVVGFQSTNYLQMEMGVTPLKSHGVVVTHSSLRHNHLLKICVGEISKTFAETSSEI